MSMAEPVERALTERVRKVLSLARAEARQRNHDGVLPEHIALGLLQEGEGVGATILRNRGASLAALEQEISEQLPPTAVAPSSKGTLLWTPSAARLLAQSTREARALHHAYVGTEHLLLALVRDARSLTGRILRRHGLAPENARSSLQSILGTGAGDE
jgi:ATP-dependent Clp protease ATP-binding subunit ClpC